MTESRIKISSVIENQLPSYVKEEFPLVEEFLSQYYLAIENQGNVLDILQNIDQYVKVDNLTNLVDSTTLISSVSIFDTTINVESTVGFPDSYGLIKIDNEIITYKSKTSTSFVDCSRGFSGVEAYRDGNPDKLKFSETEVEEHALGTSVQNLSILFLKEFFNKVKKQVTPGFEDRSLSSEINQGLFIKQANDFYSSKGTSGSFEILFRALYGKDVEVILPRDYLIQPSDAQYRITKDLVVEAIEGNPLDLINLTLYQESIYQIPEARGTVSYVERIVRGGKEYYVISLDYGYDNLNDTGFIYGEFTIHPTTRTVVDTIRGSDTLTVDSTAGFPLSGIIKTKLENGTELNINYESKSLNQFYGCTGIDQDIPKGNELNLDVYAYGHADISKTQIVKVRVTGVLSDLTFGSDTKYYERGDTIKIKTLGKKSTDKKANNWFFNIGVIHNIKSIEELDSLNFKYRVELYDPHLFYLGDSVTIIPPQEQPVSSVFGTVTLIRNEFSVVVSANERLGSLVPYQIKKNTVNAFAFNYLSLNKYTANVQNTYLDDDSLYVTSNSLPFYQNTPLNINDRKIIFSGIFNGTELTIENHNLYTGDVVVYNPEGFTNKLDLTAGKYFVSRVNNNKIKLSRSRNDLFNNNYIEVTGAVTDNIFYYEKFTYEDLSPKIVQSQKLIRQIKSPEQSEFLQETPIGYTGIFINGVELKNYKSNDFIYYGPIEEIQVLSGGSGYDVINPPKLTISDSIGFGATAYPHVIGSLEKIEVIDGGINYNETPKLFISGGNGFGATAEANLESYDYEISFNSTQSAGLVSISNNTIGFSTYHNFNNGEEVIYRTNGQRGIGGISTGFTYYVSLVNSSTIKLHNNITDAVVGINTINISLPYGEGNHTFRARNKRRKIRSVTVTNPGFDYRNRRISTTSVGINTASDTINIDNHGLNNKDLIVYSTTGTPVSGLSTTKNYYVIKVDDNNFKLAEEYTQDNKNPIDFYYSTSQFSKFTATGSGQHIFRDKPIEVEVVGSVGISTFSESTFATKLQPIFRGEIDRIFIENVGKNYGSEDILNYNRQPEFIFNSGSGAELKPVIYNGSIVEVFVVSSGVGYNSPPNLAIESSTGFGAILTPVVENGFLTEVRVISGGTGYLDSNTSIRVDSAGIESKLRARIKSWHVNLVERLIQTNQIVADDGIIDEATYENLGLEYSHAYAPRNLRSSVFTKRLQNNQIIYDPDLIIENRRETASQSHSPIIGWSYDGNPIYGPYGYSTQTGGSPRLMKSGYEIKLQENRPSLSLYPEGFFVEDYEYSGEGDLDECNGRFCITPEYPNGVYAYFCTISDSVESSGVFNRFRKPIFPYVIGNFYKSIINDFNFSSLSNQDELNINNTNWLRNTNPYYLTSENSFYEFLIDPNKIQEQNSQIVNVKSGKVNSISIVSDGDNYSPGDSIIFDSENTGGKGVEATVSSIKGKNIVGLAVSSSTINNIELIGSLGISSLPLTLGFRDFIRIDGIYPNEFSVTQTIQFISNQLTISSGIGSVSQTGIVTYLNVYPPINASVNDLFYLGDQELVKILNIDYENSKIRILRNQNGTQGVSSFSAGTVLTENPTKFAFNSPGIVSTFYDNREIYFNPVESVGVGTTSGVGIGVTLYFTNPGAGGTSIFIPTRSIYIPKHNIQTGTELLYNSNTGTPLSISTNGVSSFTLSNNSIVYAAKISDDLIGISTLKVGLGTNGTFVGIGTTIVGSLLYFTGIGTGVYHSFKLNPNNVVKADITRNIVNVFTSEPHNLLSGETIKLDIIPEVSKNIVVKYNDYSRRTLIDPISFTNSNVDPDLGKIYLPNHNLSKGQKVVYEELSNVGGLSNNEIYYVIPYGPNYIRLANTYYNASLGNYINLTTQGSGKISPINPRIIAYKHNPLVFDLSDSSLSFRNNNVNYSAFNLKFYSDPNFVHPFDKSNGSEYFNVVRNGSVGIDTNATVTLLINNDFPERLFYRLEPRNIEQLPEVKKQIFFDNEFGGYGEIIFEDSVLKGTYSVSGIGSTTFTYTVSKNPENNQYNTGDGTFEYERSQGRGKIKTVAIKSGGSKYKVLPSISQVSSIGSGALLYPESNEIGSVTKSDIVDIGFSYSSDNSIRPTAKLPEILKIYNLSVFDKITVLTNGKNYTIAPNLIVFDGKTDTQITDVDLSYELENKDVKIIKNTSGIYDVTPRILPINNSNGIGINSIAYNPATKNVTVYLKPSYSDAEDFPFDVGERVLIENVGVASTFRGYNSENYNYSLFTITQKDANIGGSNGSVTYNLSQYLETGEAPGPESVLGQGFIVPEKYFPTFDIKLKKLSFYQGETVTSNSASGLVQKWDSKNSNLKVITSKDFVVGEVVTGESSGASAVIDKIYKSEGTYSVDSSSIVKKGWFKETGFLNKDTQRIQDSDYYQYFSYALKSEISIDKWDDSVEVLNHTAGFKKFSDLVIKSDPGFIGLSTIQTKSQFIGIADLYSVKSTQCYDDFDLVSENNITLNQTQYSDEITFNSKILQDYIESIGNKVLSIDDISSQFNSNPRAAKFSIIDTFDVNKHRSRKYFIYATDRKFINEKETVLLTLLHDGSTGYLNQYARVETSKDLGYFDFNINGTEGNLLFYPNKEKVNNYNLEYFAISLNDTISGIGTQNFGDVVKIQSHSTSVSSGISTFTVVGIASTYRSSKILVQIGATDSSYYEFGEINLLHDNNNVYFLDYGQLTTGNYNSYSSSGIGTYHAYLNGSNINVDFILNTPSSVGYNINSVSVSIANTAAVGVSSTSIGGTLLESNFVSIASSTSPVSNIISQSGSSYNSAYYIVSVTDTTNNNYQLSELVLTSHETNTYLTEYGIIENGEVLGEFDSQILSGNTNLLFTPIPNINVEVRVFKISNGLDATSGSINLTNATLDSSYGLYQGTEIDIKREFNLTNNLLPIFERQFDASDSTVVDVINNTIYIPGHYFTTGEEIEYSHGENTAIGIATTSVIGIGTTNKLPSTLYVVKVNDLNVKVSASASDSLLAVPNTLDLVSVGVGTGHIFRSKKLNEKTLITLDNVIQSPIVSTAITSSLSRDIPVFEDLIAFTGITSFFSGDIIKVDDEIMKITGVGIGSTNFVTVIRPWMGTEIKQHSAGSTITKIKGNYNIINDIISFAEPPYGIVPLENPNNPDEIDYSGISTSSTFSGRVFLRSGITNSNYDTYKYNYIFDDIADNFDGFSDTFTLTSGKNNITGFSTSNSITLINNVFQLPSRPGGINVIGGYDLSENSGITSISFVGTATSVTSDINASNLPRGGIIVSVGSSKGFGYQPLVSAGGTAIVSVAGTIQSISIGNSGSGYRSGVQIVKVGVGTSSLYSPNIEFIGTASVSGGRIVSVAITNPGTGYTASNPPYVFFDSPLSYSNIPLIYSSSSSSGLGTEAKVDIVVGQGSSVISFEIKNFGYGYDQKQILTIPIGGSVGIPTNSSLPFKEFQLSIERTFNDDFSGWSVGDLQVLDPIESLFDGKRVKFPIKINGNQTTIRAKAGSNIDVALTLLIFINDVLQIPDKAYVFNGGSVIRFTEPPKQGDTCKMLFYKGTGDVDTLFVDILETVKPGDTLQINSDEELYKQSKRSVTEIVSSDIVHTVVYPGPGLSVDPNLLRPVTWCKQMTDLVVNGISVTKDRIQYEPYIYPVTNIIQNVSTASTEIFVESVKTFFDSADEYVQDGTTEKPQRKVLIVSQNELVGAAASAIVSVGGSITSISIIDGGVGYTTAPSVSISSPIGIGTTFATATASITAGVVTSISVSYSGYGYNSTNPPQILIEPPTPKYEQIRDINYSGDFGIITGVSTVTSGVASTGITFDLFIPLDSYLRDPAINKVGIATTGVSGIKTGYYFVVNNSNIGKGVTSLNSSGSVVGLGSTYLDNIYQAVAVSIAQTSVPGVGVTYVTKVTVSVKNYNGLSGIGYSSYFGNYSWGRLTNLTRTEPNSFEIYNNGIAGISTSPTVRRFNTLKYSNYNS